MSNDLHVTRLISLYERACAWDPVLVEAGINWYANAYQKALSLQAAYSQYSLEEIVGAIAALSPQVSWKQNLRLVSQALEAHSVGRPITGQTVANTSKVQAILDGAAPLEVLGGLKVRAFYECILTKGDTDTVCVDRHALSAWYLPGQLSWPALTPNRYGQVARDYQIASRRVHLTPANFQAAIWCAWRECSD